MLISRASSSQDGQSLCAPRVVRAMKLTCLMLAMVRAMADNCQCPGLCTCSEGQCTWPMYCDCNCNPTSPSCHCTVGDSTQNQGARSNLTTATTMRTKGAQADLCSSLPGSYSGEILAPAQTPSGFRKTFEDATMEGTQAVLITPHCTKCRCDGGFS